MTHVTAASFWADQICKMLRWFFVKDFNRLLIILEQEVSTSHDGCAEKKVTCVVCNWMQSCCLGRLLKNVRAVPSVVYL